VGPERDAAAAADADADTDADAAEAVSTDVADGRNTASTPIIDRRPRFDSEGGGTDDRGSDTAADGHKTPVIDAVWELPPARPDTGGGGGWGRRPPARFHYLC
jgi:hypothetical protein